LIVERVEVFADIVCPFTHVGLRRFRDERHARSVRVPVRIRAWPLELVNGTPLARDLVRREVEALRAAVMPDLFAGFEESTFPSTSIPAFGLAAAAYAVDHKTGEAVSFALRDALFEQGLDVADLDVLRAIGLPFGVVPLEAAAAEASARCDWERGKVRNVRGSPHFFVGDRSWFCPSLEVGHTGDRFDIAIAGDTMREFYEAALGGEGAT
jgi:predicted DsbA family dithiol-disulfide isomerase